MNDLGVRQSEKYTHNVVGIMFTNIAQKCSRNVTIKVEWAKVAIQNCNDEYID